MAAKRSATTELNDTNWNEESLPEEAGMFTRASDEVLEKRILKSAKRRLPPKDGSTKSAFGTFTGFKTTAANSSPFSFLASTNTSNSTSTSPKTNTSNVKATSNGASKGSENGAEKKEESTETQTSLSTSGNKKIMLEQDDKKIFKKSSDYFAKLKGLNESVAQWIKTHVDANPFCILTPIFKDYERYLKEIESKHGNETESLTSKSEQAQTSVSNDNKKDIASLEKKSDNSPFGGSTTKLPMTTTEWKPEKSIFGNISTNTRSIFGKAEQTDNTKSVFSATDQNTESPKSIFGNIDSKPSKSVFGNLSPEKNPFLNKISNTSDNKTNEEESKSDTKSTTSSFTSSSVNTTAFSFGSTSTTSNVSAGFSFGSAKPFSFDVQAVKPQDPEDKAENEGKEDEDEEPPKPDFKPVTEEGAIYEQRCKVFVKKDGNFSDRGIGTLFLKPTPNGKMQLIVRADTSLGNLLLNTLLTESIPLKRMNKNTIMMVCLPMPDSQPPPVPVLLRVKTEQDADLLFETLNKHKK